MVYKIMKQNNKNIDCLSDFVYQQIIVIRMKCRQNSIIINGRQNMSDNYQLRVSLLISNHRRQIYSIAQQSKSTKLCHV